MGGKNHIINKPLGSGSGSVNAAGRGAVGGGLWDAGAGAYSMTTGNINPAMNSYGRAMNGTPAPAYQGPMRSANYTPGGNLQGGDSSGFMSLSGGVNRYGEARPDHLLLRGEDGGLDSRFESTMGDSFAALKAKGMTEGDTKSAALAREAQEVMRQGDVDRMRAMQSSGVTQGMRNLAARGGVATGSRERLMRDATRQGMRGMQGIGRENRLANLGISQSDEAMKNQLLGQTGQVEQQIQGNNIKLLAQDIASQNMAGQNIYGEDMRALGAIETGKAQASAGKSSGGLFK